MAPMKPHFIHRSSIETAESMNHGNSNVLARLNTNKAVGVVGQSFNQLMVETAYSANLALGDEMNVVQIRYGLLGPNTACMP